MGVPLAACRTRVQEDCRIWAPVPSAPCLGEHQVSKVLSSWQRETKRPESWVSRTKRPPWISRTDCFVNPFPVTFLPVRLARLGKINKLLVTPVLESLVCVETKERDQRQYDGGVDPVNHDGLD